jgi:hypothetical protein
MSKNTKIIAIVGGVLIVLTLAYMMLTGGSIMDAVGCGGKKGKKARQTMDKDDVIWANCQKHGYVAKMQQVTIQKGKDKGKKYWTHVGGKRPEHDGTVEKATCACLELWKKKCADPAFSEKYKTKSKLKKGGKKGGKAEVKIRDICQEKLDMLNSKCKGGDDDDDDGGDDDKDDKDDKDKQPKGKDSKSKGDGGDDDSDD